MIGLQTRLFLQLLFSWELVISAGWLLDPTSRVSFFQVFLSLLFWQINTKSTSRGISLFFPAILGKFSFILKPRSISTTNVHRFFLGFEPEKFMTCFYWRESCSEHGDDETMHMHGNFEWFAFEHALFGFQYWLLNALFFHIDLYWPLNFIGNRQD